MPEAKRCSEKKQKRESWDLERTDAEVFHRAPSLLGDKNSWDGKTNCPEWTAEEKIQRHI
jgi:hypothetical protein